MLKEINQLITTSKWVLLVILKLPLYLLASIAVISIRLVRPWCLIRVGGLFSHRIGHLAANTELYLCERDVGINLPTQRHVDLFYVVKPISNYELVNKWRPMLRIWPTWFLGPIKRVNRLIPGWASYEVGENTQSDRDIHHLLERLPLHLKFSSEEEYRGKEGLIALGIESGARFVCLLGRDSAYLKSHEPSVDYSYHDYRDCEIENFVMAAEELAKRGYYVIRMGVVVKKAMQSTNPKVIDYAAKGLRTEFMDLYLGAKCEFCVSVGSGFDAIPYIFRRPIVFVNHVPIGYLFTFEDRFIGLTKHHFSVNLRKFLTLQEIFSENVGYVSNGSMYALNGVKLIENSPEEIKDIVIEMVERLDGTWESHPDDEMLQDKFRSIFKSNVLQNGEQLHGDIQSRYGASFLRNNRWWLETMM